MIDLNTNDMPLIPRFVIPMIIRNILAFEQVQYLLKMEAELHAIMNRAGILSHLSLCSTSANSYDAESMLCTVSIEKESHLYPIHNNAITIFLAN